MKLPHKTLRKAVRRTWMKYAMRGVRGAHDYQRLELAYRLDGVTWLACWWRNPG